MIKKISVSELYPNMYIHDLDCGWMEHPFLQNSFMIKGDGEIEKIVAVGIRHVYIDTDLGLDVPDAPSADEVNRHLDTKIQQLGQELNRKIPEHVTAEEELSHARRIFSEANTIVSTMLLDCRMGKQVELEKITPVVAAITGSIFRNPDALISLLRIKQADKYTFQHSVAVSTLLISFCRTMGVERQSIEHAGIGGLLHDVGKMSIPNAILNKPGKLTETEFETMKLHVDYGCRILQDTPNLSATSYAIAAEHHERYDGSGYPKGLKDEEISLFGQMASIIDVYDALTSNRVYHTGIEPTEALKKILEWSEYHFNTQLVHQFIRAIGIYPVGTLVRLESGYLAVVVEQHHENLLRPKVKIIFNGNAHCYVPPKNFDLSKPGCNDRIVSFESPQHWHLNPLHFL